MQVIHSNFTSTNLHDMDTLEIIDVTTIEAASRHSTIFKEFELLNPGESFAISSDHDPAPLLTEMRNRYRNSTVWEYMEQGPAVWIVKFTKTVGEYSDKTIAEIVTKDIRTAKIFRKYGIDFCCGGKKPVAEVCAQKNIDVNVIMAELATTDTDRQGASANADKWALDFLAGYIVNFHHNYVKESIPAIRLWADKVAKVHGDHNPETIRIAHLFTEISDELTSHMFKEENVLFPYIVDLVNSIKTGKPAALRGFGTVVNPIRMMEHEHETVGNLFKEIETLSGNFTPPEHACNTFRALYSALKEFEDDLFLHIHLENNILFPKAIAMESENQTR